MSLENVQAVIARMLTESDFRELLFSEPNKALEGYELTEQEATALMELEREKFDAVAGELEDRLSKSTIPFPGSEKAFTPQPEPPGRLDPSQFLKKLGP